MLSAWLAALVALFLVATLRVALAEGAPSRYVLVQKDLGLALLLVQYLVVGAVVRGPPDLRSTLRAFVGSVCACNAVALLEFGASRMGWFDVAWMNYGRERVSGLLLDPNAYGGLLASALPFLIVPKGDERGLFPPAWSALAQVTLMAGVVLTFSRSAWVAVGLILLWAAWRRPAAAARLGLALAGALLALGAIVGPGFTDLLQVMALRQSPVIARLETSRAAWEQFLAHPVFGVGLGWFREGQEYIVHNTGLWLLAEMGLVGLVVFLGLMTWMLRRAVRVVAVLPREDHGLALGLAGAFVAMLALSLGIEALYQRHWWLVMGLIAAGASWPARPEGGDLQ
jgi:O-antigen ligase